MALRLQELGEGLQPGKHDAARADLELILDALRKHPTTIPVVECASFALNVWLSGASPVRAAAAAVDAGALEALTPCLFVCPEAKGAVWHPWRAYTNLFVGTEERSIERAAAAGGIQATMRAIPLLRELQSPQYFTAVPIFSTFLSFSSAARRAEMISAGAIQARCLSFFLPLSLSVRDPTRPHNHSISRELPNLSTTHYMPRRSPWLDCLAFRPEDGGEPEPPNLRRSLLTGLQVIGRESAARAAQLLQAGAAEAAVRELRDPRSGPSVKVRGQTPQKIASSSVGERRRCRGGTGIAPL